MASREYSTWKRRPSGEKVLREWLDYELCRMIEGSGYVLNASICHGIRYSSKRLVGALNDLPYSDRAINISEEVRDERGIREV